MHRNSDSGLDFQTCSSILMVVAIIAVVAGIFIWDPIVQRVNEQSWEGTIVDAYIKRVGEVDVYHAAIKLDDGGTTEVFHNKDAWTWGKFNSADVQQQLLQLKANGLRVRLKVTGWRVELFSWFQNVVKVEPLS